MPDWETEENVPVARIAEPDSAQGTTERNVSADRKTIGVFDSGIGGFTVAGAILKRRPDLNLVYYADSVNLPYGGRSQEQLARLSCNIIEFLLTQQIDILADGCNTSHSALNSGELRNYDVPIYDLVSSTVDWIRKQRLPESVALLATEATVRSGWWEAKLSEALPGIPFTAIPAPELVPLIESAQQDERALREAVGHYMKLARESGADTVVLGCTHYPLVQNMMADADIYLRLVDPAQCLAEKLTSQLAASGAELQPSHAGESEVPPHLTPGSMCFYNSRPSERFYAVGERVFGKPIRDVTRMYIVNPYED